MNRILVFSFSCVLVFLASCSDEFSIIAPESQSSADDVLAPCTMTRAEALNLMLSQGVGFGYNGVEGEECNVPDVRSQVLDPNAIRAAGIRIDLNQIESSNMYFSSKTGYSLNELLEKVYFGGGANANLSVVFK